MSQSLVVENNEEAEVKGVASSPVYGGIQGTGHENLKPRC